MIVDDVFALGAGDIILDASGGVVTILGSVEAGGPNWHYIPVYWKLGDCVIMRRLTVVLSFNDTSSTLDGFKLLVKAHGANR